MLRLKGSSLDLQGALEEHFILVMIRSRVSAEDSAPCELDKLLPGVIASVVAETGWDPSGWKAFLSGALLRLFGPDRSEGTAPRAACANGLHVDIVRRERSI